MENKFTTGSFQKAKTENRKITMLTSYDYCMARIVDQAGIDAILVGDSLGMVMQGKPSTLSVTVDDIIYHTKLVRQGVKRAMLIADMPFMSYTVSKEEAVRNAGRIIKETGAEAVKLEGGANVAEVVEALVKASIPVMGHVGMTPQSVNVFGGFKVQGKSVEQAQKIYDDAKLLDELGVFAITLECVPNMLAKLITENVSVPTIGIGAGKYCDGQVLVLHDMLGLFDELNFKFLKKYESLSNNIINAINNYKDDVVSENFPSDAHSYHMKEDIIKQIKL